MRALFQIHGQSANNAMPGAQSRFDVHSFCIEAIAGVRYQKRVRGVLGMDLF